MRGCEITGSARRSGNEQQINRPFEPTARANRNHRAVAEKRGIERDEMLPLGAGVPAQLMSDDAPSSCLMKSAKTLDRTPRRQSVAA